MDNIEIDKRIKIFDELINLAKEDWEKNKWRKRKEQFIRRWK